MYIFTYFLYNTTSTHEFLCFQSFMETGFGAAHLVFFCRYISFITPPVDVSSCGGVFHAVMLGIYYRIVDEVLLQFSYAGHCFHFLFLTYSCAFSQGGFVFSEMRQPYMHIFTYFLYNTTNRHEFLCFQSFMETGFGASHLVFFCRYISFITPPADVSSCGGVFHAAMLGIYYQIVEGQKRRRRVMDPAGNGYWLQMEFKQRNRKSCAP